MTWKPCSPVERALSTLTLPALGRREGKKREKKDLELGGEGGELAKRCLWLSAQRHVQ